MQKVLLVHPERELKKKGNSIARHFILDANRITHFSC